MNYQNELLSIANNYIKKNNLEKYIEDIKFLKSQNTILPEDVVASYSSKTRQIFYNLESALNDYEQFLDLVYYMYHELTHVKQNKIRKENIFTIEKQLYDYEYNLVNWQHKIYELYYNCMSIEYNADIEGIINTCNYLNIELNNCLYNHINNYYVDYEQNKLYELYKARHKLKKFYEITSECNYDETKKLLLGLPIEKNTYKKILTKNNPIYNDIKKYVL